jgi:hypothetical protein
MISSIMPFDPCFVGIPASVWLRDVTTWIRRVAGVGGSRALLAGALLCAARPVNLLFLHDPVEARYRPHWSAATKAGQNGRPSGSGQTREFEQCVKHL